MTSLVALLLLGQNPCGPLDLGTALDLAARRSDEVAIKQADVATAEVELSLAKAIVFIPQASITGIIGPDPGANNPVNPAAPNDISNATGSNRGLTNLGIFERVDGSFTQPLWTWGQLTGAREAAKAGLQAREHLADDTLSEIQLRVIQLYWADALATKFLAIADDVDKALDDVDQRIATSLKNEDGDVSPQDKYQVALFRAELNGRKAEAVHGKELARIGLAATLALPRDKLELKELPFAAEAVAIPAGPLVIEKAIGSRNDLKALSAGIEAKKAEVQIKTGAMFPALFVAGVFSAAYAANRTIVSNPYTSDPFNELELGAVLGIRQDLSLPTLWEQKRKAESELHGLERQKIGLERLIETQVEGAIADLTAAQARAKAARDALGAGKSWFRASGLDFQAGVGDAKALLLAYKGYVESQVSAAQAAYDVAVARARLDRAIGVPLGPSPTGEAQCILP